MTVTITRQQRRATERRSSKPEPATIERKSARHIGRTKCLPFSRMNLVKITPGQPGKPAIFHVQGYTKNRGQDVKATPNNIDWFVRGITPEMRMAMLGM